MSRLKNTSYEETRVQVSISYDMNYKKTDDDALLDVIEDVSDFKAVELQKWGCGTIPNGFVIFQGERLPTKEDKESMITAVNVALSKCKIIHTI